MEVGLDYLEIDELDEMDSESEALEDYFDKSDGSREDSHIRMSSQESLDQHVRRLKKGRQRVREGKSRAETAMEGERS